MDGVLVVDKPLGPTSHDVVARVRRALKEKRIGHTGTLDPLATGVLPLVVGRATRLAQFLSGDEKEYVAGVRFGAVTATFDAEARVVNDPATGRPAVMHPPDPVSLDASAVQLALDKFRGTYWQVPPPFSAKKIGGVPAYRLARSLKPVEVKPVEVTASELELVSFDGSVATLRIVCSTGFYVRTLAHELGQRLECGAYLESLLRTRAGQFTIDDAVPLEAVERDQVAINRVIPMERLLPAMPGIVLNERGVERASHGNSIAAMDVSNGDLRPRLVTGTGPLTAATRERVRLLDTDGRLLGIAERTSGDLLRPFIVLV